MNGDVAVRRVSTPTARAVALALAGAAVAAAVGLAAPSRWPLGFLALAAVAALALTDLLLAARDDDFALDVAAPALMRQGDEAEAVVHARLGSGAPAPAFEAALEADGRVALFPRSQPLASGVASFRLRALRRGRAALKTVQLRWAGPLGLVRRQTDAPLEREIVVAPDIAAARAASRALGETLGGAKLDPRLGQGGEFRALRAYRGGDERRRIDWKRSAARGELLVQEFQLEQNHPVVLAIDTGRQMAEPVGVRPRLDHALSAALALGFAGLAVGDRVKLCGFDARVRLDTAFMSGRAAFAALQAAAGRLESSTEATNFTLGFHTLAGALDRRALVVVFTEFTDTTGAELMLEQVGRLIRRHAVMFVVFRDEELEALVAAEPQAPEEVSRAVIAARLLRERALVLERLRRLGVRPVETTPDRMGGAVVDAYLDLKRRELG